MVLVPFWHIRVKRTSIILDPGVAHASAGKSKKLRVAPGRGGHPISSFWRIWAQGDEVYAAVRTSVRASKVSLHSGGKWFMTIGTHRHELVAPQPLEQGAWLHALELRFLISEERLPPMPERKFKPSQAGLVIESPPGAKVIINILFGAPGTTHETALPTVMSGSPLLQLTLRDGTCVTGMARLRGLTEEDHRVMRQLGEDLGLQLHSTKPWPKQMSVELMRVDAITKVGNIVAVMPMGPSVLAPVTPERAA